jgi:hypothetical protein
LRDRTLTDWQITVEGTRVHIERDGTHFYTAGPFDQASTARTLAQFWRFAIAFYGHPFATDDNPTPEK